MAWKSKRPPDVPGKDPKKAAGTGKRRKDGAEHLASVPESQKMVLTVPTINQNINRSPLFCYYQNFKPSQIEFLKVKCKNIF